MQLNSGTTGIAHVATPVRSSVFNFAIMIAAWLGGLLWTWSHGNRR
jgi:predicted MFS family arabinose efflux permease